MEQFQDSLVKEIEDIADGRHFDEVLDLYVEGSQAEQGPTPASQYSLSPDQTEKLDGWVRRIWKDLGLALIGKNPTTPNPKPETKAVIKKVLDKVSAAVHRHDRWKAPQPTNSTEQILTDSSVGSSSSATTTTVAAGSEKIAPEKSSKEPVVPAAADPVVLDTSALPVLQSTWCPFADRSRFKMIMEKSILKQAGKKLLMIPQIRYENLNVDGKSFAPESAEQKRRRTQYMNKKASDLSVALWLSDHSVRHDVPIVVGSYVTTWQTKSVVHVVHGIALERGGETVNLWLIPLEPMDPPPMDFSGVILLPDDHTIESRAVRGKTGLYVLCKPRHLTWVSIFVKSSLQNVAREEAEKIVELFHSEDSKRKRKTIKIDDDKDPEVDEDEKPKKRKSAASKKKAEDHDDDWEETEERKKKSPEKVPKPTEGEFGADPPPAVNDDAMDAAAAAGGGGSTSAHLTPSWTTLSQAPASFFTVAGRSKEVQQSAGKKSAGQVIFVDYNSVVSAISSAFQPVLMPLTQALTATIQGQEKSEDRMVQDLEKVTSNQAESIRELRGVVKEVITGLNSDHKIALDALEVARKEQSDYLFRLAAASMKMPEKKKDE